jgi:hypothetical protein
VVDDGVIGDISRPLSLWDRAMQFCRSDLSLPA